MRLLSASYLALSAYRRNCKLYYGDGAAGGLKGVQKARAPQMRANGAKPKLHKNKNKATCMAN